VDKTSVKRAIDATGDNILTYEIGTGELVQAVVILTADESVIQPATEDGNLATIATTLASVLSELESETDVADQFPFERHQYMGSQTVGNYVYYGYKQFGGTGWYIMRKDTTDDSAWQYAYSASSVNDWATAWASPDGETYGDPPDS